MTMPGLPKQPAALKIDLDDNGNSVGIFQFESQGMTNFMKELKPDSNCLVN